MSLTRAEFKQFNCPNCKSEQIKDPGVSVKIDLSNTIRPLAICPDCGHTWTCNAVWGVNEIDAGYIMFDALEIDEGVLSEAN